MDPPPPHKLVASASPTLDGVSTAVSTTSPLPQSPSTMTSASMSMSTSSTVQIERPGGDEDQIRHRHRHHHHSSKVQIYSAASFVGPLLAKSLTRGFKSGTDPTDAKRGVQVQKRKFGLLGCIFVILGCVLGSGIFAAPEAILKLTENAGVTLLIWFVAGAIASIAALCYVELGCTFPVSGGDYAYLKECFGNYPAFLFQISLNTIVTPVSGAILATTAAKNLIVPNISKDLICKETGDPQPNVVLAIKLVAIMFIMLFGMINCKIPEFIEKIQGYLMMVNMSAILLMVTCGMVSIGLRGMPHANFQLSLRPGKDAKDQVLIMVNAIFQASFSYFGYTYANYMTEELERPLRNLPLGVGISMPIIVGVNLLINFCYITTITLEDMTKTQTIADDMFRAVLPSSVAPYLAWFATTLVAFSVCGGLLSYILTCSRLPYAGARNGDFPPVFKLVDRVQMTPVPSIIYICCLSSIFCMVGTIEELILVAAYLESAFNCLCIYGLIYVRFKRPLLLRPIKLPLLFHFTYAGIASFLFIVPIVTVDGDNYRSSIPPVAGISAVILCGTPLYFIFIRKTRTWPWLRSLNSAVMKTCQKMWLVSPEDVLESETFEDFDTDSRPKKNTELVEAETELSSSGSGMISDEEQSATDPKTVVI